MLEIHQTTKLFMILTNMQIHADYILSHIPYCSVVYHYCSRSDIIKLKLEIIQKKDLRFVYHEFQFSYTILRENSNRPFLYVERQRCILQKCIKVFMIYLHDLFIIKDREYNY